MALTDESTGNGFYMPVAPAYGGGGGFGNGFGGDGWWILLLLLAFGGGWGNGFGGGFGGDGLYPWLNNSQNINGGFRDQMLNTQITSIGDKITSGFGDVATQLCGGFAGVNASITNAQMNTMQQIFGVQSAIHDCCCTQSANTADLKYTIASEACTTRAANAANTQAVLDKLCQLELDGYKRENDQLRSQLTDARFAASQVAQTAQITDNVYNRLSTCPVGTVPVYGESPIFRCNNNGCGCGM